MHKHFSLDVYMHLGFVSGHLSLADATRNLAMLFIGEFLI